MRGNPQKYRVVDRIAAGGMAEVFRAESAGLEGFKKKVAIKRVLPHLSEKKSFIAMFLDEARLCAHLSHSNCVQVFDVGVGENSYFIVMEYVDGADLKRIAEWLKKKQRPFPIAQAVYICAKICEGLAYAHHLVDESGTSLNIVHRDLSPPNVLLTKYGEVKIVDFGLAKANTQLEKSDPGIIKGKFSYLSPEAALGRPVDLRTDLFAVGIILWELIAGRKLFQGETDLDTVRMVQRGQVADISPFAPGVDATLKAILAKGLAADPNDRYQTAQDFGSELTKYLYQTGQTVTGYEIADTVRAVMADLQKERKAAAVSQIDRLIEDTLFEFSSLDDDAHAGSLAYKGYTANKKGLEIDKSAGFESVGDWFADEGGEPAKPLTPPPPEAKKVEAKSNDSFDGLLDEVEAEVKKEAKPAASSPGPTAAEAPTIAPAETAPATVEAKPTEEKPAETAEKPASAEAPQGEAPAQTTQASAPGEKTDKAENAEKTEEKSEEKAAETSADKAESKNDQAGSTEENAPEKAPEKAIVKAAENKPTKPKPPLPPQARKEDPIDIPKEPGTPPGLVVVGVVVILVFLAVMFSGVLGGK